MARLAPRNSFIRTSDALHRNLNLTRISRVLTAQQECGRKEANTLFAWAGMKFLPVCMWGTGVSCNTIRWQYKKMCFISFRANVEIQNVSNTYHFLIEYLSVAFCHQLTNCCVKNSWSHPLRWCDDYYYFGWGECLSDDTPRSWYSVELLHRMRRWLLTLKVPPSGQQKKVHHDVIYLRRAQIIMLVQKMESENVGVCQHSSSSHLDDLVHPHFFYDLLLQLVDS